MSLKHLREEAQWTQEDLQRHSKVDQGTISRLERGLTNRPALSTLAALARSLNARYRKLHIRLRVRPEQLVEKTATVEKGGAA